MRILHPLIAAAILLGAIVLPVSGVRAFGVPTGQAASLNRIAWDAPHAGDQLLVKLSPDGRSRLLASGARILHEIPALSLALVELSASQGLAQAASQLAADTGIEWAEPNYTIGLDFVPNDPGYQTTQKSYLSRLGVETAWDYTRGRPETVIAVLDTGVDMQHEDLAGAIWTNPGETGLDGAGYDKATNGIDDDGNGFVDDVHGWDFAANDNVPDDDHGHGTHVAGIAAARIDNGKGIAGIAGRATIMPVDVFQGGIGTYDALIRAIVYATDNGARIINMSLGASSYSRGEEAAVDYAYDHGVVVVAAAGNTGSEELHYPGAHLHAIAVASTTADDAPSTFSTRGAWVDVAAPGSAIYSTYRGNTYVSMSGTSMATPHVAGLAALILSRNPTLTPDQVRTIIENSADDLGPAGRDIYFGAGRINAGRALAQTSSSDEPPPGHTPQPGLDVDLPGCVQLVANGGFEEGTTGWEASGATEVVTDTVSVGGAALHFQGGPNARGVLAQTFTVPANSAAVLKFDYRIDPQDTGRGISPAWPFDDWFTAEWRKPTGELVGQLLRTGNTADTVDAGLQWDHYLYRLGAGDLAALAAAGPVELVFTSQNDADNAPTNIWLDAVSFCVSQSTPTTTSTPTATSTPTSTPTATDTVTPSPSPEPGERPFVVYLPLFIRASPGPNMP